MWSRFTERARRVIFFAQEEAAQLGQSEVGPEHLLLSILRDTDSTAVRVLLALEIDVNELRRDVLQRTRRVESRDGTDMRLTPLAKHVIDLAYRETRTLLHDYLGTEHLLLGLTRSEQHLSRVLLEKHGVDPDRFRDVVFRIQGRLVDSEADPLEKPLRHLPFRDLYRTLSTASGLAGSRGSATVELVHMLVAGLAYGTESAGLLIQAGVQVSELKEALLARLPTAEYSIHREAEYGAATRKILERVFAEFAASSGPEPDSRTILRALLDEEAINAILSREGINLEELRQRLSSLPNGDDLSGEP